MLRLQPHASSVIPNAARTVRASSARHRKKNFKPRSDGDTSPKVGKQAPNGLAHSASAPSSFRHESRSTPHRCSPSPRSPSTMPGPSNSRGWRRITSAIASNGAQVSGRVLVAAVLRAVFGTLVCFPPRLSFRHASQRGKPVRKSGIAARSGALLIAHTDDRRLPRPRCQPASGRTTGT
jgi:hypothetical protein